MILVKLLISVRMGWLVCGCVFSEKLNNSDSSNIGNILLFVNVLSIVFGIMLSVNVMSLGGVVCFIYGVRRFVLR